MNDAEKTDEILTLAEKTIRIPSVSIGGEYRSTELCKMGDFIEDFMLVAGCQVRRFDQGKYPAILIGFPDSILAPAMLSGHFDVVAPDPDDRQFESFRNGDYLWGRGSADMKTVLATYMIWMKDAVEHGPPFPKVNMLFIGNEETGEGEPMGTPHILDTLYKEYSYAPELIIAGERTEETGAGIWGQICTENRGVTRFQILVRGKRMHSSVQGHQKDLAQQLLDARKYLSKLAKQTLTLESKDNWISQLRFPFIKVGIPGVYNITPENGLLGVEIRVIPEDNITFLMDKFMEYCRSNEFEVTDLHIEPGIICPEENPFLGLLLESVNHVSGNIPVIGKKLHGTSARFAPEGNGIVWGQSGIGPHTNEERHYIPSIFPYYQALKVFGQRTTGEQRD